ncbi:MAG: hypothetical protein ABL994_09155 [Verrucomicrobiales bacterium]
MKVRKGRTVRVATPSLLDVGTVIAIPGGAEAVPEVILVGIPGIGATALRRETGGSGEEDQVVGIDVTVAMDTGVVALATRSGGRIRCPPDCARP